jgi:hypothetical protein
LEKALGLYKKSLISSSEVKGNGEKSQVKVRNVNLSTNNYQNDEENNTCSFRGEDNKTKVIIAYCGKPSFDKKKQLCRSHNKQV